MHLAAGDVMGIAERLFFVLLPITAMMLYGDVMHWDIYAGTMTFAFHNGERTR